MGARDADHNARWNGATAAHDCITSADNGEGACGRNSDCVHMLRDQVLAQHCGQWALPVGARAGERGAPASLELDLVPAAVAEEGCAAVAKQGHERAELVACVGGCNAARRTCHPGDALIASEPLRVEVELGRD